MTAPDISSITESLRNFSLNSRNDDLRNEIDEGTATSSITDDNVVSADNHVSIMEKTLELNSHLALPYNWEQCLDLQTGEIYFINWNNGTKVKEDPRRLQINTEYSGESCFYPEEDNSYDSEESSTESSPSLSSTRQNTENLHYQADVLVVAGCKGCLMYSMVPKLLRLCPKCSGQLLHFDRSDYGSP